MDGSTSHVPDSQASALTGESILCNFCQRFVYEPWQSQTQQALLQVSEASLSENMDETIEPAADLSFAYTFDYIVDQTQRETCHLCCMVSAALNTNRERFKERIQNWEQRCTFAGTINFAVHLTPKLDYYPGFIQYLIDIDVNLGDKRIADGQLYVVPHSKSFDTNLVGQPSSYSTSSEETFAQARSWLSACLDHHTQCKTLLNHSTVLPARLLDIEAMDSCGKVVLHELASDLQTLPYLTLSHCWGKSERLQLLQENIAEFEAGVPLDRLTLTFQHAIDITRRLGHRYLWIDRLCIIQNSPEDWTSEASKMAGIYGNAVCCIAAGASADSNGGIYRERKPLEVRPLHVPISPALNNLGAQGPLLISNRDIMHSTKDLNSPLNGRGWILQEQVLSPRMLFFEKDQILWECRKHVCSEIWPAGAPIVIEDGDLFQRNNKAIFDTTKTYGRERSKGITRDTPNFWYRRWDYLVHLYTKRSLTKSDDKLPALFGMTDVMMSICKDEYLAGLWRNDTICGLTWHIVIPLGPRLVTNRAPSWSWASIDGMVEYSDSVRDSEHLKSEVLNINMSANDLSTIGKPEPAKLVIRGMLREINWHIVEGRIRFSDGVSAQIYLDTTLADLSTTIYLFHLLDTFNAGTVEYHVFGLILTPVTQLSQHYRRVGFWMTSYPKGWPRERVEPRDVLSYTALGWKQETVTLV